MIKRLINKLWFTKFSYFTSACYAVAKASREPKSGEPGKEGNYTVRGEEEGGPRERCSSPLATRRLAIAKNSLAHTYVCGYYTNLSRPQARAKHF